MTILQSLLKSSAKTIPAPVLPARTAKSPIEKARAKLVEALTEQLRLIDEPGLVRSKRATRKDRTTGEKVRKDVDIPVKSWLSVGLDEKPVLSLRYGNTPLELQPGKSALSIATGDVKGVLSELVKAVQAGELDVQLAKVAQSTKQRFGQKTAAKK
jgi:hypothetical protein